ncbi:MAG: M23 family metallopeptidase [Akkermansiaceae bacterium]|nr:M23 family metallopeptidase [Akkermansiaceae bacterium]
MMPYSRFILSWSLLFAAGAALAEPADLVYRFPTENQALLKNKGADFYMYCDRNFEGKLSKPWQAGGYGMVRNPFRAGDGQVMYSRLHEGIDIKPMSRDARGEPLDEIHPVAPGCVVYVSDNPGMSNYGRYIVVSHSTPEGTIYSLYAHLSKVSCKVGQQVGTGNVLGIMGHTGAGINRERSHVHLEICLLIHSQYDLFCPAANKHGIYNGLNLIGIDPSPLLIASQNGDPVSLSAHWNTLQEHYRVRVPYSGEKPDFLVRYPFLFRGSWNPAPQSLEVAFSAEGVPLAVYPSQEAADAPSIVKCTPLPTLQQNATVNRVKNNSKNAQLTASGLNYIKHFFWKKPATPAP